MSRKVYIENKPLEEAQELFMQTLNNISYFLPELEDIEVKNSLRRVLGKAVYARRSSPHYLAAAMDGIAVKAVTTYGASETNPVALNYESDYIEVDTGDYVPPAFDAVIMIEDVNFIDDNTVQIIKPAIPWQQIRSVGEDMVAHDMLAPSMTVIGPEEIGCFSTADVKHVEVLKKPLVAIIPTGTELRNQGSDDMEPGEIIESNSYMLAALCTEWGADYLRHDIVIDDRDLLRDAVLEVKDQADMIVICSGSSAGREDYTSDIVAEFGQVLVHGIATRPGKPAILGIIDGKPVIGVPGYPVSAHLVFNLFARPVLLKKQGLPDKPLQRLTCTSARKLPSPLGVDEYVYTSVARIQNDYLAFPLNRGAGITTSLVKADGVIHIERGNEGIDAGQQCTVYLQTPTFVLDNSMVAIGSHDLTIDVIADLLNQNHALRLISSNAGSMGGLMALNRKETQFAGIHLLDEETGSYNISYIKKYLPGNDCLLVHLVKRQQGLMVKKSNPLQISGIRDLLRSEIRFINRQKGSGTRVLLDYKLKKENLDFSQINGYNREEYTHLAIAAAVKNDAADAGLGIYASAKAMDLDFIPIVEESYDLCILPELMPPAYLDALMTTINSKVFKDRIESFGGYSTECTGQIVEL